MIRQFACILLIATLLSAPTSVAQHLSGVLVDEQNSPLSNVAVGIRALHKQTTTDQQGRYAFKDLPAGLYAVEFSLIGFKSEIFPVSISTKDTSINVMLHASLFEFRSVTVTASPGPVDILDSPQPVSILEGREFEQKLGQSTMQSVEMMPGVAMYSGGPLSMKPVIRGLGSQRVVVAENGLRHESQQWDDDQSPGIDALDVQRVEILRGPNSVLFGSDALGGVINIIDDDIGRFTDQKPRLEGNLMLQGFSNSRQGAGSLSLSGRNDALCYKVQADVRQASDISTPAGELQNTGEIELNGKVAAGLVEESGNILFDYSHFGQKIEIPPDPRAHLEVTPFQKIAHDKFSVRYDHSFSSFRIESHALWQRNEETEYSASDSTMPDVDLVLNSLALDIRAHHNPVGQLFGTLGVSVEGQKNETLGLEALIPSFNQLTAAGYLHEELLLSQTNISAGFRYDVRRLDVNENDELNVSGQTRNYHAFTGGLGAVWHASDLLVFAFNLGRGWRAPLAEELFVNGVDQGGMRYKTGEPDLKTEASLNVDGAIRYVSPRIKGELSVFRNRINDYIYLKSTGEIDPASGLIKYVTRQANATLTGGEFGLKLAVSDNLILESGADIVLGKNEETESWLPLTPAPRTTLGLRLTQPSWKILLNPYLSFDAKVVLDQNRVAELETSTGGYTLFGIRAGGELPVMSEMVKVDCSVENLLNRAYADHLSRYKAYAFNPGRDITLKLSVPFDVVR
ncbi:MAG: TonB-dependent receptor [Bacteroidota bacterium]|jgi:iron complex outermembrane receptor protein